MTTTYKRRFGDRKDGRKIRTMHPMEYVSPFIMVDRNDASNYFRESLEISHAEEYIRRKREEGLTNFGYMHLLVAAYVRTISQYPGLNRFISGQRIYARNEIAVNMMVKTKMAINEQETAIKVKFSPEDTANEVYERFQKAIDQVHQSEGASDFDSVAKIISKIPRLLKKFIMWILRIMDYFGILPKSLTEVSPFHGSIFITSMGSLGIQPVYHHLYNFGNVPVFLAFGSKHKKYELSRTGEVLKSLYLDIAVVTDERICDGFYFSSGFRKFGHLIKHPDSLDKKPEQIVPDID